MCRLVVGVFFFLSISKVGGKNLFRDAEMCSAYKEDLLVINLEESYPKNLTMLQGNGPVIVWK
jgi:hypothetical protein